MNFQLVMGQKKFKFEKKKGERYDYRINKY